MIEMVIFFWQRSDAMALICIGSAFLSVGVKLYLLLSHGERE